MYDINDKELIDGSIIDMHQTINGENLFVLFDAKIWMLGTCII